MVPHITVDFLNDMSIVLGAFIRGSLYVFTSHPMGSLEGNIRILDDADSRTQRVMNEAKTLFHSLYFFSVDVNFLFFSH